MHNEMESGSASLDLDDDENPESKREKNEEVEFASSSSTKTPKGVSLDGFNKIRTSFDDVAPHTKKKETEMISSARSSSGPSSAADGLANTDSNTTTRTGGGGGGGGSAGGGGVKRFCLSTIDFLEEVMQVSIIRKKAPQTPLTPAVEGRSQQSDNIYYAQSDQEILDCIANNEFVKVDPLYYDISNEAKYNVHFDAGVWIEDILINILTPLSYFYVYFKYGIYEMRNRHMITGLNPEENPIEHDKEQSLVQMKSSTFFVYNMVFIVIKFLLVYSFIMGGYSIRAPSDTSRTAAPAYFLFLTACFYLMHLMMYANKKALRCKASKTRLLIEREKRNEELLSGWMPLPWWVALFELRIAAEKSRIDPYEKIYFKNVTAQQLREAIGAKTLSYLERPRDDDDLFKNVEKGDMQGHIHVYEDKKHNGSSCTVMAIMLRGLLENSYAHPAFGEDGHEEYAVAHFSKAWFAFAWVLMLSPLFMDIALHDGSVSQFDGWGIMCCVVCFLFLPLSVIAAPPSFIWAAIVSIERKTKLQCFLNNLLDPTVDLNHHNKSRSSWPYAMDLSEPNNIKTWNKLRTCCLKFGKIYSTRTDINGGMMVFALGCATASFILFTAVNGTKIYVYDIAFYVLVHMFFVITLGLFCMKLAIAGEDHNEFVLRSKAVLASAVLNFESELKTAGTSVDVVSVRSSFVQLQEFLNADEKLHQHEVLGMIPLNKALVGTIAFICFTQITLLLDNVTLTPP